MKPLDAKTLKLISQNPQKLEPWEYEVKKVEIELLEAANRGVFSADIGHIHYSEKIANIFEDRGFITDINTYYSSEDRKYYPSGIITFSWQ